MAYSIFSKARVLRAASDTQKIMGSAGEEEHINSVTT
jgi:hypothetical protein